MTVDLICCSSTVREKSPTKVKMMKRENLGDSSSNSTDRRLRTAQERSSSRNVINYDEAVLQISAASPSCWVVASSRL
jgi:hypothetical protein